MSAAVWTAREAPQRAAPRTAAPLRQSRAGARRADRAARRLGHVAGACRFAVATGAWTVGWLVLWVLVPVVALGWTPVAITSGSMAPLIRAGDVVVLDPDAALEPGAVVTVPRGGGHVTHRLVAERGDGTWTTRGDANAVADREAVRPQDVLGVGRLVVPLLGVPAATLGGVRTASAAYTGGTADGGNTFVTGTLTPPVATTSCETSTSTILLVSRGRTAVTVSWSPVPGATSYLVQRRRPWNGEAEFTSLGTTTTTSFRDPASGFTPSAHGDMDTDVVGSTSRTNEYRVVAVRGDWQATSATRSVTAGWTYVLGVGTFDCA